MSNGPREPYDDARSSRKSYVRYVAIIFSMTLFAGGLSLIDTVPTVLIEHSSDIGNQFHSKSSNTRTKGTSTKNKKVSVTVPVASEENRKFDVDFIVAGFAKCGTSTLLYSFDDNPETNFPPHETCLRRKKTLKEGVNDALHRFKDTFSQSEKEGHDYMKRGVKCPVAIEQIWSMFIYEIMNPGTKVIIGVRHPVLFFQSYYNYRVVSHVRGKKKYEGKSIPDPYSLKDHHRGWRGVHKNLAKFDKYLMQLGKVNLTDSENMELESLGLKQTNSKLPIFLYEIGQLEDEDELRSDVFREDMQHFLGLKEPIPPFAHRNAVANKGEFDGQINICEPKFDDLRKTLIGFGEQARPWIGGKFIESDDVFIGGDKAHFLTLLSSWGDDPCIHEDGQRRVFV
eukprot:scaffold422987_cov55-Attheya_sp.AAC.5